ncbi:unnamed protein product [Cuscuta europaea]|uniref:Uncharacterized protein n=1 Tax=Cuscuta europaea TaxID=41803 RepID=A0A9P0YWV9_CUSEU|nr:unnamed protein product [Cuscuta europaea]
MMIFSQAECCGQELEADYYFLFKADQMILDKRMKPQTSAQSIVFSLSTTSVTSPALIEQSDLFEVTEDCSFIHVISRRNKKKLAIQTSFMQTRSQLRLKT